MELKAKRGILVTTVSMSERGGQNWDNRRVGFHCGDDRLQEVGFRITDRAWALSLIVDLN